MTVHTDGTPTVSTPPAKTPKLVQEIFEKIDSLEARAAESINSLDDDIGSLWEILQLSLLVQGTLVEAVNALSADPGNPHTGAARAREIMSEVEDAYGPDEGPEDDGVVQQSAGDPTGDA